MRLGGMCRKENSKNDEYVSLCKISTPLYLPKIINFVLYFVELLYEKVCDFDICGRNGFGGGKLRQKRQKVRLGTVAPFGVCLYTHGHPIRLLSLDWKHLSRRGFAVGYELLDSANGANG